MADQSPTDIKPWAGKACWAIAGVTAILTLYLLAIWLISVDTSLGTISKQLSRNAGAREEPEEGIAEQAAEAGPLEPKPRDSSRWRFTYTPRLENWLISKSTQSSAFAILYKVDLSTVTPLLLLLFAYHMMRAAFCVATGRRKAVLTRTFPFPPNFVIFWVQLGLIGTIAGFLILGAGLENVQSRRSEETINLLVAAFGTALLSTFVGVVLAYVLAPPVQWLYARFIRFSAQEEEASDLFVEEMNRAVNSFTDLSKALDGNRGALVESLKSIAERLDRASGKIEECFSSPRVGLAKVADKLDGVRKTVGELQTAMEKTIGGRMDTVGAKLDTVATKLEAVGTKIEAVGTKIEAVGTRIDTVETKLDAVDRSVADAKTGVVDKLGEITTSLADEKGKPLKLASLLGKQSPEENTQLRHALTHMTKSIESLLGEIKRRGEPSRPSRRRATAYEREPARVADENGDEPEDGSDGFFAWLMSFFRGK